jgi:predicted AAA+ superfamily ATPase
MLYRNITADVQAYLTHFPSLLITGARQVGKSTLALSLRRLHLLEQPFGYKMEGLDALAAERDLVRAA